ncbi:MAG: hypothetical protein [Siphoviridae sp. ctCJE6]|nr:MAG: hypothetical protein [Siphoviridae sp. ctCJE6]
MKAEKFKDDVKKLGDVKKCRGCGAEVMFVKYYNRREGKEKDICVDLDPVYVLIPIFPRKDNDEIDFSKVDRWVKRRAFRQHREFCSGGGDGNGGLSRRK